MNSKNSKTFDPHRLLLNLTDKIDLKRKYEYSALNYQLQNGMKNLNYLMGHILYQMFKIILNIYLKNMEKRQFILQ